MKKYINNPMQFGDLDITYDVTERFKFLTHFSNFEFRTSVMSSGQSPKEIRCIKETTIYIFLSLHYLVSHGCIFPEEDENYNFINSNLVDWFINIKFLCIF